MSSQSDVPLRFKVSGSDRTVSALLRRPPDARCLYVLAHGAGAGMRHAFMQGMADRLATRGVASFRYQFPYMESGRRAPDPRPLLLRTVGSAVEAAISAAPDLPLLAGGKSMGGRMTSLAASENSLAGVRGLILLGFPLHAMGKHSVERGAHLKDVGLPMLFVQGTRDKLADLDLLRPLLASVHPPPALHIIDDGDHSFKVPKRTGLTENDVLSDVADVIGVWSRSC